MFYFLLQKHALMEQVAHQTIVMQFILELAKSLKVDPRGCFRQFFEKIKVTSPWLENNFKCRWITITHEASRVMVEARKNVWCYPGF